MFLKSSRGWEGISRNWRTTSVGTNRSAARSNSLPRRFFANSTRLVPRRTTPRFRNAWFFARPSWKKSASRSKTLSSRFSRYGILFVLSAPSGAGKTTLVDALRRTSEFVYSVSCTTRPARAAEAEGQDYQFLTDPEFTARAKAGEFLEHAQVHGHHYGTLLRPIVEHLKSGRDVLIDIDTQGAATIRNSKDKFVRDAL